MKTTIEIADDLISRAKRVQKREDVTLRALVEEGLRVVLDRHVNKSEYKFEPIVAGEPWRPGRAMPDVNAIIAASNERPWLLRRHVQGAVHETPSSYRARKKRITARKRKG